MSSKSTTQESIKVDSSEEAAVAIANEQGSIAAVEHLGEEIDWLKTDLANIKSALKRIHLNVETIEARTVTISSDVASMRAQFQEFSNNQRRMRIEMNALFSDIQTATNAMNEARGEIISAVASIGGSVIHG